MDGTWTVVVFVIVAVACFGWFIYQSSARCLPQHSNMRTPVETVLRHDIPRYTFTNIYDRFPFDVNDPKLKRIQQLEQKYMLTVDRFIRTWKLSENETTQPNPQNQNQPDSNSNEPSAYIRALRPQIQFDLNNTMFQITDLLNELYDLLIEYCNVKSENVLEFQDCCEDVYELFEDIRRLQQARIRQIM